MLLAVINEVYTNIPIIADFGQHNATLNWTRSDLAEHLAIYNLAPDFYQGSTFPIGITNLTRAVTGPCGKSISYIYYVNVRGEYLRNYFSVNFTV